MKNLTKKDLLILLDLITDALNCRDEDSFKILIFRLQTLFEFESSFCGYAKVADVLTNENAHGSVININFPPAFLERYLSKNYHLIDSVAQAYFQTLEIQNWRNAEDRYPEHAGNIVTQEARDFGLLDGMTYGSIFPSSGYATSLSFAGKHIANEDRTRTILKYAIPHLSQALQRILHSSLNTKNSSLTPTEIEVLKWLKEGKSSWEISKILHKSERTINFHAANIIKKLDAMNRTHAVAIALQRKIIEL